MALREGLAGSAESAFHLAPSMSASNSSGVAILALR